jgi:adenylate cyclase class IV
MKQNIDKICHYHYFHIEIDNDNDWGWFIDIDNDINKNNVKQIIRISNNYKGGLPPICEIDEVPEIDEVLEIEKNNDIQKYFNVKSITTTTLFVLSMIYILY